MREKLQQFMQQEGLTSSRLAAILEVQPSGISHILSGRNKPGYDLLQKILSRFPQINPDWLLLDSDRMYRAEVPAQPNSIKSQDALPSLFDAPAPVGRDDKTVSESELPKGAAATFPAMGSASRKLVRIACFYDDSSFEVFYPRTE